MLGMLVEVYSLPRVRGAARAREIRRESLDRRDTPTIPRGTG